MAFEPKKSNEYPTFIEEGQEIVNQKDKIENQQIENLSDIPETNGTKREESKNRFNRRLANRQRDFRTNNQRSTSKDDAVRGSSRPR